MLKNLLPLVVAGLLCLSVAAQQKAVIAGKDAIFDAYVQAGLKLWQTPGMSIAVVKDGKIVFKKGYGVTEVGKPAAFSTSTLSICASSDAGG